MMSQPVVPVAPMTSGALLRQVEHPDLSPALTHFCSRARRTPNWVPVAVQAMTAAQRLENILWSGQLQAFVTFSGGAPAVCLTESRLPGVEFLIGQRGFAPWGLVFLRQGVFNAGGGPVWYARAEQFDELTEQQRVWAVRLEPPRSDWLEEREWRIPRAMPNAGATPGVSLAELGPYAVIVGDLGWTGARHTTAIAADTGQHRQGLFYPHALRGVLRFWWNPATQRLEEHPPLYA